MTLLVSVELLVVHGDPNASKLVREDHQWTRIRRRRVLHQTRRNVLVQGRVDVLDQDRAFASGPRGKCQVSCLPGPISKKEAETKENNPAWIHRKFAAIIAQLFDGQKDYVRAMYLERNALKMQRNAGPVAKERRALARNH